MSDIALCKNQACPIRFSCLRYWAEPNKHYQSYSDFKPKEYKGIWRCSDKIQMTEEDIEDAIGKRNNRSTKHNKQRAAKPLGAKPQGKKTRR